VFFDVGYAGRQGCRPLRQDNQIRLCKVRADGILPLELVGIDMLADVLLVAV